MNIETGFEMYSDRRQGLQLDIAYVIQRLFETFPGIELEEEYFHRQFDMVREITKEEPNKAALAIAIRDAEERGPLFRFTVRSSTGSPLAGGIHRYYLAFKFDTNAIDPELKAKAEQFLASFSLNRFTTEAVDPGKTKNE
jgi:hypothetical protein